MVTTEPSPLLFVGIMFGLMFGFWLALELVKFIANPKRYVKQIFCYHWYKKQSINDMWRLHDYKFKCCECGKVIYCNYGEEPLNSDYDL